MVVVEDGKELNKELLQIEVGGFPLSMAINQPNEAGA
jgi:hypothetical protein